MLQQKLPRQSRLRLEVDIGVVLQNLAKIPFPIISRQEVEQCSVGGKLLLWRWIIHELDAPSDLVANYPSDLVHEGTLVHDVGSAVHRADEGHLVRSIDERCLHLVHEATP